MMPTVSLPSLLRRAVARFGLPAVLLAGAVLLIRSLPRRPSRLIFLLLPLALAWGGGGGPTAKEMRLTVFAVGKADALVIETPKGNITADAERAAERAMLERRETLRADVLKVGHHGGNSSSSPDFLNAVRPRYAVISCKQNDARLPHPAVVKRLQDAGAEVYRTDRNGAVTFRSDGRTVRVQSTR